MAQLYHKGAEVMPITHIFWDCTWERHGDYLLLRNEFGRVVGMLQIFTDAEIDLERSRQQDVALCGHILNTGRQ